MELIIEFGTPDEKSMIGKELQIFIDAINS